MSIPQRLWRLLRSEVNHRLGKFDTPEHKAFRAAWEEAQRAQDDWVGPGSASSTPKSPLDKHYETLGLTPGTDFAEVRVAYKALLKQYHPDRFQDPAEIDAATDKVQAINEAYTAIKQAQF